MSKCKCEALPGCVVEVVALLARWRSEANQLRHMGLQMADPTVIQRQAEKIDERADELETALTGDPR